MVRENFSIGAFYNVTKNQDNPIKTVGRDSFLSPKTPKNTSFLGVTQPPGVAQPLYSRGHNQTQTYNMCPSLIEIGSKTAEKNSAQRNRQTNRQTDIHYENNGHLAVNQYLKLRKRNRYTRYQHNGTQMRFQNRTCCVISPQILQSWVEMTLSVTQGHRRGAWTLFHELQAYITFCWWSIETIHLSCTVFIRPTARRHASAVYAVVVYSHTVERP